jgi:hypothetical protein
MTFASIYHVRSSRKINRCLSSAAGNKSFGLTRRVAHSSSLKNTSNNQTDAAESGVYVCARIAVGFWLWGSAAQLTLRNKTIAFNWPLMYLLPSAAAVAVNFV